MEAVLFQSSPDQHISPQKTTHTMKTHKRGAAIHRPFISRPSENFVVPLNLQNNATGVLQAPLQVHPHNYINLSQSYPPFSMQKQQQPPLLPLPISYTKPIKTTNVIHHPPIIRGLSCPPTTHRKTQNKVIRSRHSSSLTPMKSKTNNPKTEETSKSLGLGTKDLPKDAPKILTLLSGSNIYNTNSSTNYGFSSLDEIRNQVDELSGPVVFTISPPPSCLPLPTFSLRPKVSCNAEAAAGIDAGATDNLCRLLHLR